MSKCYLPVGGLYQEIEYSPIQVASIRHEGRSFNKDWPKPANWNKNAKMKRETLWLRRNTQRKRDIQITANTKECGQTFALWQLSLSKSMSLFFHVLLFNIYEATCQEMVREKNLQGHGKSQGILFWVREKFFSKQT